MSRISSSHCLVKGSATAGFNFFVVCLLTLLTHDLQFYASNQLLADSHTLSHISSSLSSSFPSFLHVSGASQYPGMPYKIDAMFRCCYTKTLLPRDKLVIVKGYSVYEYDSIAQETRYSHNTTEIWNPPYGPGVTSTVPFGLFNSTMFWSNEHSYWFMNDLYWRYRPADGGSPNGQSDIASGWMPGIVNMDGMFSTGMEWSYALIGPMVWRYNNVADGPDLSDTWPKTIDSLFGADFPLSVDDADLHPDRQFYVLFKNDTVHMYNFVTKSSVPGYPRPMHQDNLDGGVQGMGRTRCSNIMDLSGMIGFVEDKSPDDTLRAMPYADNLNCQWHISVPDMVLRQYGYNGFHWIFDRFDLGSDATLTVEELNDKPPESQINKSDWKYTQVNLYTSEYQTLGINEPIPPRANQPATLLKMYNSSSPPTLNVPAFSSKNSMTLRVRFTSGVNAPPQQGTGFALRFAVTSPDFTTYTSFSGLVWFGSTGIPSTNGQVAIVRPASLTPTAMAFTFRFNIYPYDPSYFLQLSLTATSGTTGEVLAVCRNETLFERGILFSPRCTFETTAADYPVVLTFNSSTDFSASVIGEYYATSICNTNASTPLMLNNLTGAIADGSGPNNYYRIFSDCHWLIVPPEDLSVLFVTLKFDVLELIPIAGTGGAANPPAVTPTDFFGPPTVTMLDGDSITSPVIGAVTPAAYDVTLLPTYASTGPLLRVRFQSAQEMGDGWSARYNMHFPPLVASIQMRDFTVSTSPAISDQLRAIKSNATMIVKAGVKQLISLSAIDRIGRQIDWSFQQTYQVFFRWIPLELVAVQPEFAQAITYFPQPLNTTNSTYWQVVAGFTGVTDAQLESILETKASGSSIDWTAPHLSTDYAVRLVFVLRARSVSLPDTDGWGSRNLYFPEYYSYVAQWMIVHVVPATAVSFASTAFVPPPDFNLSALSDDWTNNFAELKILASEFAPAPSTLAKLRDDSKVSVDLGTAISVTSPHNFAADTTGTGSSSVSASLNNAIEAGTLFSFLVCTRDEFGNQMEGFDVDDIRAYMSSIILQISPNIHMQILTPGLYYMSVRANLSAKDYVLTVLVSGTDISGGPFHPKINPGNTSAVASTIVVEKTGDSIFTNPLPAGDPNLILRVTLMDRYSNIQLESIAQNYDRVSLVWPDHNVRFLQVNGSSYRFAVATTPGYDSSVINVRVNDVPFGYDPSVPSTASYLAGVPVTIGTPTITYLPTPLSQEAGLVLAAGVCMCLAILLIIIVHRFRAVPIIRASSPPFLYVMLCGAVLEYSAVIPIALDTPNEVSCAFEPLLAHLGFFAIFGSLFVKTQRVRTIFTATKLKVQTISDLRLMGYLAALCAAFLLYYALWMAISRPMPTQLVFGLEGYTVCASDMPVFPAIPLVVEACFVLYGAYLSASIWSIPSLFNESKFLLASIYNVAVVGGLLLCLVKLIITQPPVQLLFTAVGILFVTTVVLVSMFVLKIYTIATTISKGVENEKTVVGLKPMTVGDPTHRAPSNMYMKSATNAKEATTAPGPAGLVASANLMLSAESAVLANGQALPAASVAFYAPYASAAMNNSLDGDGDIYSPVGRYDNLSVDGSNKFSESSLLPNRSGSSKPNQSQEEQGGVSHVSHLPQQNTHSVSGGNANNSMEGNNSDLNMNQLKNLSMASMFPSQLSDGTNNSSGLNNSSGNFTNSSNGDLRERTLLLAATTATSSRDNFSQTDDDFPVKHITPTKNKQQLSATVNALKYAVNEQVGSEIPTSPDNSNANVASPNSVKISPATITVNVNVSTADSNTTRHSSTVSTTTTSTSEGGAAGNVEKNPTLPPLKKPAVPMLFKPVPPAFVLGSTKSPLPLVAPQPITPVSTSMSAASEIDGSNSPLPLHTRLPSLPQTLNHSALLAVSASAGQDPSPIPSPLQTIRDNSLHLSVSLNNPPIGLSKEGSKRSSAQSLIDVIDAPARGDSSSPSPVVLHTPSLAMGHVLSPLSTATTLSPSNRTSATSPLASSFGGSSGGSGGPAFNYPVTTHKAKEELVQSASDLITAATGGDRPASRPSSKPSSRPASKPTSPFVAGKRSSGRLTLDDTFAMKLPNAAAAAMSSSPVSSPPAEQPDGAPGSLNVPLPGFIEGSSPAKPENNDK